MTGKACGNGCISKNDICKKPKGCACDGRAPSPSTPPDNCKEGIIFTPMRDKSSPINCKDYLISIRYHDKKCGLTNVETVRVRGSLIEATGTGCTACNPSQKSYSILADGKSTGIQNVAQIVSVTCETEKPSKQACKTAIKILTDYERLAQKLNTKLSEKRIKELNRKRDNGTITIFDLPKGLRGKFPGELQGYTLQEIRDLCK